MKSQKPRKKLNPENILIAEFEYAAQNAFQTNEDRIKINNYYIGTGATLLASTLIDTALLANRSIIAIISIGLATLGFLSLLKLIRLRIAWKSSVRAMNQIKNYFTLNSKTKDLGSAFSWKNSNTPKLNKIPTINFIMALELIFINSFALGFATWLMSEQDLAISSFVVITTILIQLIVWFWLLRE